MPEKYYRNKLYPFQDDVLHLVQTVDSSFYLTGGTVLSRCYLHHRYSDDLDFFVNADPDFKQLTRLILDALKTSPSWQMEIGTVSESFVRVALEKNDLSLKIDFVNDVKFHKGDIPAHSLFHRVDNWANILSNKLCALSRIDVKDMVDIVFLSKNYPFKWRNIIQDAKEKDLWVEPLAICKLIKDFPKPLLGSIKWISPADSDMVADAIDIVHDDIFYGRDNSLCK